MRILYIHQYFATRSGTTGTRSYEQARAMQCAGHDVTMLTTTAQLRDDEIPPGKGIVRRGIIDGVNAIVLDIPYEQHMSYPRRVRAFFSFLLWGCVIVLTETKVDLVYATSTPLTVGIPALLGKLFRSIPYVFEVRDLWPDGPVALGIIRNRWNVRVLKELEAMIYRHARLIVALNEDVAREIRTKTAYRKLVIVVPNACDTDLFSPDRDGAPFRKAHHLEDKIVFVHAGAMGLINGLDAILETADTFRDREDVRFLFIGDGSERQRLRDRAEKENLNNVLFLDPVPKNQLADALAASDVGLMTVVPNPIMELNCANKFFDYLSSGLPVVLNYRGWQGRALDRWGCGLSAPQGDTEGFIRAVSRVIDDQQLRRKMARKARKLGETEFNRKAVVRILLESLQKL